MIAEIALLIGAYLLGSLPYMMLLGRARGIDLSQEKDLHIALWRKVGRLEGLSGAVVDTLKGVIPVLIGFAFDFKRREQAGVDRPAVDDDGARAALAGAEAFLGAGKAERVAQEVD